MIRYFINPGDVVLVESPSYVGALGGFVLIKLIFNMFQWMKKVYSDALEEKILEVKRSGKQIKFLYTIPNFNNPVGVTLVLERREQIVRICDKHHVLII